MAFDGCDRDQHGAGEIDDTTCVSEALVRKARDGNFPISDYPEVVRELVNRFDFHLPSGSDTVPIHKSGALHELITSLARSLELLIDIEDPLRPPITPRSFDG